MFHRYNGNANERSRRLLPRPHIDGRANAQTLAKTRTASECNGMIHKPKNKNKKCKGVKDYEVQHKKRTNAGKKGY